MGAILGGCISAGIYTSNSTDACHYCSDHSRAEIVVLEGNKQLEKYSKMSFKLPSLKAIVVWGDTVDEDLQNTIPAHIPVYSWEEFLDIGKSVDDISVEERWKQISPGNCASLIYTSGTTGPPKAVMISHDNLTWTANQVCFGGYMDLNEHDRAVSYLPLSHIAAQLIDIHCMLLLGAAVYFARPDALKGSLVHTMKEVRPTIFFGVPRVWEKIHEKLKHTIKGSNILLQMMHKAATSVGHQNSVNSQIGGSHMQPWGYFAASWYLNRLRDALGLDKCKGCFTAAAPISVDTLWFFADLDIPVFEVFGQSECTGPHTISAKGQWIIGHCGRPLVGTDTKIDENTRELCYRGRHIFMGYLNMPQETADSFDENGFLKSGDVAEMHPSGLYRIVGRIKDIIVTAGGENVAPSLIEGTMKAEMEAISHAIVVGDHRKFLSALISLQVNPESDNLSRVAREVGESIGSTASTYTEAQKDEKWTTYINNGIAMVNNKAPSNAQKIQKWRWIPEELSEQGGETTATQKVKRNVVIDKFKSLIDDMYVD